VDISRRLVWLAVAIATLDVLHGQWAAGIAELLADFGSPSRFCDPRFFQTLKSLQSQAELFCQGNAFGNRTISSLRSKKMIDYLQPLTIALIPALIVIDWAIRGRRHDSTRFWRVRATLVTIATFYFAGYVAVFWGTFLGDFHLIDGSGLGTWAGALVGILVYELGHYWYHRSAHAFDWLWRAGHQMHHSAESLDAFGAYYLHPVDTFMFTTIGSLVFFPLLGLTMEAGLVGAFFLTFNAMFQHMSMRTPRWLGFVIQRPESHSVHHGKGIHRYNYSDLPLWDMIFGTFRNPKTFQREHGFYKGASGRIGEMLLFRDVTSPEKAAGKLPDGKVAA
jgi:sterol desaturase/sphingolipid hydroxylase (fatty acid hydroxylase superfamily)